MQKVGRGGGQPLVANIWKVQHGTYLKRACGGSQYSAIYGAVSINHPMWLFTSQLYEGV